MDKINSQPNNPSLSPKFRVGVIDPPGKISTFALNRKIWEGKPDTLSKAASDGSYVGEKKESHFSRLSKLLGFSALCVIAYKNKGSIMKLFKSP